MDFYIDWPTVTVVIVVATLITLTRHAVRLAIWSTGIFLRLGGEIRAEGVKTGENGTAQDGALV